MNVKWWKVAQPGLPIENERVHVCIESRYITIFRYRGQLFAMDSICYHAGGPLTLGPIQDIEDLGRTVVLCPWHRFMVSLEDGKKVYQGVDIVNNAPVTTGWKVGKVVQRSHKVKETSDGIYVTLNTDEEVIASDGDSCSEKCAQSYPILAFVPQLHEGEPI